MVSPILRATSIDFTLVVRDASKVISLLEATTTKPKWRRHTFVVVIDDNTDTALRPLQDWYRNNRQKLALPELRAKLCPPRAQGNMAALRQQAINLGENPFVFFQLEDDPLPEYPETLLRALDDLNADAIYGQTQTTFINGNLIEIFPTANAQGQFMYNPVAASRMFPVYLNPHSALFRRSVFDVLPFDDGQTYKRYDDCAFFTRLLFSGLSVASFPKVIKRTVRPKEDAGVITPNMAKALVHDGLMWLKYVNNPLAKAFQEQILGMLQREEITSFREIEARIEDHFDAHI